jgi:hypothetical protein
MTRYDKLALSLVALLVASHVGAFVRDIYLAQTYGPVSLPPDVQERWDLLSAVIARLVNIGAAVWLYFEAARSRLTAWVWAVFGLCFGLLGLVVYYLLLPYASPNHEQGKT